MDNFIIPSRLEDLADVTDSSRFVIVGVPCPDEKRLDLTFSVPPPL